MHFSGPGHPERSRQNSAQGSALSDVRSPINTVGVLPSSLPDYHRAFMAGQPQNSPPSFSEAANEAAAIGNAHDPNTVQTAEQRAATASRLKPHSRSSANLERMSRPEGMTPVPHPQKKPKATRWQFGIRSRNQPAEAMLAIYKALKAMNAEWEVPRVRHPPHSGRDDSAGSFSGSDEEDESLSGGDDPDSLEHSADEGATLTRQRANRDSYGAASNSTASSNTSPARGRRRRRVRERYSAANDWGYNVPSDPWIINARFRKDGMFPPGIHHPHSAHSSRGDLMHAMADVASVGGDAADRTRSRRSSTLSSDPPAAGHVSSGGSATDLARTTSPVQTLAENPALSSRPGSRKHSATHVGAASGNVSGHALSAGSSSLFRNGAGAGTEPDEHAFVYMTIQLYSIEKEFYLVDFKCAGYERLVRMQRGRAASEVAGAGAGATSSPSAAGAEASAETTATAAATETKPEQHSDAPDSKDEYVGEGRAADEKDISSPFPFLDVASRLIIQLAEAE